MERKPQKLMELNMDSILKAAVAAVDQLEEPIFPQPVPTSVTLSTSTGFDGDKLVVLVVTTPIGQNTYFLDLESAEKIADGLRRIQVS